MTTAACASAVSGSPGPGGTDWRLVAVLYLAGLGAAAQYGKISVAFAALGSAYPAAGARLGLAVGLVGVVGIVLGVVAGLVVARLRYRRTLIWALAVGAVLSAAQSTLPPFGWLLVSRVVEGASHLGIVVAAPTLIAQVAAPRDRAVALTIWSTFFGVAFAALAWGGLPLVAARGIGALFAFHGMWMVALAVLLSVLLPRDETPAPPVSLAPGAMLRRHAQIYGSARTGAAAWGWLFYTFCFVGVLTLLPPLLEAGIRAPLIGALPLVSIVASLTLGVWLLRWLTAVQVVIVGFAAAALSALALVAAPGDPALCVGLAAGLGLVQGASFAVVPQLNATPAAQAQANGALAQMGNVGNALGTPALAAALAASGGSGLFGAVAAALCLGATVHLCLGARR